MNTRPRASRGRDYRAVAASTLSRGSRCCLVPGRLLLTGFTTRRTATPTLLVRKMFAPASSFHRLGSRVRIPARLSALSKSIQIDVRTFGCWKRHRRQYWVWGFAAPRCCRSCELGFSPTFVSPVVPALGTSARQRHERCQHHSAHTYQEALLLAFRPLSPPTSVACSSVLQLEIGPLHQPSLENQCDYYLPRSDVSLLSARRS